MKYKKTIIFFIICFFGISLFFPSVKGSSDIAYVFDDNVLIDSAITDFDSTFNLKNSSYYTGHYNATWSFENDDDGTEPIDWLFAKNSDCYGLINTSFNGHDKILNMSDYNNAGLVNTRALLTQALNTTIEFWFTKSSIAGKRIEISLKEGATILVQLRFDNDDSQYYDGGSYQNLQLNFMVANQFSHFKFVLDDSANTFDCYIDNILVDAGSGLVYWNPSTLGLNRFDITTNAGATDYSGYFDAIGYSADIEYTPDYIFTFNELTSGIEFSTTGIYTNWSYPSVANTDIYVRDSNPIDNEFLRFRDNSAVGFPSLRIPFTDSITNIFSFYARFSDVNKDYEIYFQDGVNDRISMRVDTGNLRIWSGIVDTLIMAVSNDIWYNITISFDCSTDTCIVIVDSVLKGTYDFYDNSVILNYIELRTSLFDTGNYELDIDSITNLLKVEFPYPIGLNFYPYLNSTGFMEVDKWNWILKEPNTYFVSGDDEFGEWSEQEGTGDKVNIGNTGYVDINNTNFGSNSGLLHDFYLDGNIVNITMEIEINEFTDTEGFFYTSIFSLDHSLIVQLTIYHNGSLQYTYDIFGNKITLIEGIYSNVKHEFYITIRYNMEVSFLEYYTEGVYNTTKVFPLLYNGKSGIDRISIKGYTSNSNKVFYSLFDVGLYVDGISYCDGFGYLSYEISSTWNTLVHNLLFLKANGTFHTGIVEGSYTVGESMLDFSSLRNYYDVLTVDNGYNTGSKNDATFVFTIIGNYFSISTLKIDGVLLKEGINEYSLEFEYSSVNIDESYFYVVNDIMYFNHISDDSNLEYIQARFDIDDVNSTDYSISYRSYIENNAYGYMRINYTDTSNLIQLPNSLTTTRFILSQERTVRSFVVLITDKDNNVITGQTTGYIYNIELLDVLNIQVSVITESLLNMMIPLIIILTPTLIFGKKFGKQVIVPFFILLSLILTITGILPYWLFFIIVFPSLIIIFFKSKDDI